ncbi:MAG: hypothetical protein KAH32_05320 [Chlamydiia bacterium]|nr:hypothetical protein [Chlamydiia bacterium]
MSKLSFHTFIKSAMNSIKSITKNVYSENKLAIALSLVVFLATAIGTSISLALKIRSWSKNSTNKIDSLENGRKRALVFAGSPAEISELGMGRVVNLRDIDYSLAEVFNDGMYTYTVVDKKDREILDKRMEDSKKVSSVIKKNKLKLIKVSDREIVTVGKGENKKVVLIEKDPYEEYMLSNLWPFKEEPNNEELTHFSSRITGNSNDEVAKEMTTLVVKGGGIGSAFVDKNKQKYSYASKDNKNYISILASGFRGWTVTPGLGIAPPRENHFSLYTSDRDNSGKEVPLKQILVLRDVSSVNTEIEIPEFSEDLKPALKYVDLFLMFNNNPGVIHKRLKELKVDLNEESIDFLNFIATQGRLYHEPKNRHSQIL